MAGANKEQIVLVDPETLETFKVYVNPEDVSRIKTDPSYQQKIINDIKKVKNQNNLVELKLRDGSNQEYCLRVSAAKRDKASADLQYANDLLHEHLSALGSLSNVGQKTSTLKQGVNAKRGAVFQLTLVDSLTMDSYTLFVDQVTFNRVQTDTLFATELLEKHKAVINQQKLHTLSTSIEKNNDPANTINEVHSGDELEQLIKRYENDDIDNDPSPKHHWNERPTAAVPAEFY